MLGALICRTLPQAWEAAVLHTWNHGIKVPTQYDKPGDPMSRDISMAIEITEPLAEPMIHKAMPCGYKDLRKYEREVVDGVHDHWINPKEGKWSYTYHQRLEPQFNNMIKALLAAPYSRRAIGCVWRPDEDAANEHCPCAQYVQIRILQGLFCMNVHIRSNDAFKANGMNMYAFIKLQKRLMDWYIASSGIKVGMGSFTWFADSFHIYGSYFNQFKGFLDSVKNRKFEDRVIRSDDPMVVEEFEAADKELAAEN